MNKLTKALDTKVEDVNENGIVTIQITQFDKYDSDDDRMRKGALTKTFQEGKQVHLVDHRMGLYNYVGLPVKKIPETGVIESKLNLNKQIGKDLLEDYKFSLDNGRSLQHSVGFIPVRGKFEENEKGGLDFFEVKLMEYTTTLFGAVEDTPLHGIKSKVEAKEIIEILEQKTRMLNISDDYGKQIENHIKQLKSLLQGEPYKYTQPGAGQSTSHELLLFV